MPNLFGWLGLAALISFASDSHDPIPIRLNITRDTWFSDVGPEADGNNGGAPQLKLKSYQELSLVDVDPTPLKGRVVKSASLHVRLSADPFLRRVTVGTFAAPWIEGTGRSYAPQPGSSTFRHARHPDVAWTLDGGDLTRRHARSGRHALENG